MYPTVNFLGCYLGNEPLVGKAYHVSYILTVPYVVGTTDNPTFLIAMSFEIELSSWLLN